MKKKFFVLTICALLQSCATQVPGSEAQFASTSGAISVTAADIPASGVRGLREKPQSNRQMVDRTVIYKADVNLLVDDRIQADQKIRQKAKALGGWFQTRNDRFLILRIPANKFEGFIASLGELGTVTSRSINAEDITERFLDAEIRLENAHKTLERLRHLYSKAKDVKETLLIEKEINRISEIIETFKGKLKYWKQQVAYSTVKINLNQAVEHSVAYNSPFYWMESLGGNLKSTPIAGKVSPFWSNIKVKWTDEFATLSHGKNFCNAMTADGLFLSFSVREVETNAPLKFWTSQAKNILQKTRLIRISKEEQVSLANGLKGQLLQGAHSKISYALILSANEDAVATLEIRDPKEAFAKHEKAIKALAQNTTFKL